MQVVGIGAGGHAAILVEMVRAAGHEVVALTDSDSSLWETEVLGVPVVGGDDRLEELKESGIDGAFIGIGTVGVLAPRRRAFERASSLGFTLLSVTHPSSVVSMSAVIGRGTMVLPNAVVHTRARLGDNVTVYSGTVVEHDCIVDDHAHLSPGVMLGGGVHVGPEVFIGIGASIIQGVSIGGRAVVAAGAAVVRDVAEGALVAGVPAVPVLRAAERTAAT